jgi:hypothetical protein
MRAPREFARRPHGTNRRIDAQRHDLEWNYEPCETAAFAVDRFAHSTRAAPRGSPRMTFYLISMSVRDPEREQIRRVDGTEIHANAKL